MMVEDHPDNIGWIEEVDGHERRVRTHALPLSSTAGPHAMDSTPSCSLSGSFGEIFGGKPVRVFLCHRPGSSIYPSNELMRQCLLRQQSETSGGAFSRFWQHFRSVAFKARFGELSLQWYGGGDARPGMGRGGQQAIAALW
jgi:hypothetical protein